MKPAKSAMILPQALITLFTAAAVLAIASGCRDAGSNAPPSFSAPASAASSAVVKAPDLALQARVADALVHAGRLWLRGARPTIIVARSYRSTSSRRSSDRG